MESNVYIDLFFDRLDMHIYNKKRFIYDLIKYIKIMFICLIKILNFDWNSLCFIVFKFIKLML